MMQTQSVIIARATLKLNHGFTALCNATLLQSFQEQLPAYFLKQMSHAPTANLKTNKSTIIVGNQYNCFEYLLQCAMQLYLILEKTKLKTKTSH